MSSTGAASPEPSAAPVAAPVATPTEGGRGKLVLIRPDGSEGESFTLPDGTTTVGRDTSGPFANDSYLSPKHATFTFEGDVLHVKDEASLNGVYARIEADSPVELADGDVFRIGQEVIRYEKIGSEPPNADGVETMGSPDPGYVGRICLVIGRETDGNSYCIPAEGIHLGRERGDVIFPDDGYVSGLHCKLKFDGGKMMLTDVGSSNGTFTRVDGKVAVPNGKLILMGQQLFRAEY